MKKILITAPVHQDTKIFREYLWSLNRLEIPDGYIIQKYFYLHNSDNLKKFLNIDEYEIFKDKTKIEQSEITHIWKPENFNAVCKMRTMALEKARKEKYDYIFSVDSDTILHKTTLQELLSHNLPFVSKIHWTMWNNNDITSIGPNCYDGRTAEGKIIYFDFTKLKIIGLHEIGSAGGCNLISSEIFEHPEINYYPIPILRSSFWEDFAFATRCKCVIPNIKFYIDTLNPVKHLYRNEDYKEWIGKEKKEWSEKY